MPSDVVYDRAGPEDRQAILDVMRPVNMHRVPSPEMAELDLERFFVARVDGRMVGAAGWTLLADGQGKTTLLAVLEQFSGRGIGGRLQDARLAAMHAAGASTVTTNADRPATIEWYRRRYGYRLVGVLPKVHEFGEPSIDHWTTLELDLEAWARDSAIVARVGIRRPHGAEGSALPGAGSPAGPPSAQARSTSGSDTATHAMQQRA